jgi:hypothetical protein
MNRRTFLQFFSAAAFLPFQKAQSIFQEQMNIDKTLIIDPDKIICDRKFKLAVTLKLHEKPINEIVVEIAKSFLGVDYAADTIETPGKERLLINLQELDCVTFYENSLVLARCIKKNKLTYDDYKKELQFVRYRSGVINEYPSRLHYTTDYFYDNEKKGVLRNITKEIGGVRYKRRTDFMSVHIESYPRLKENPEFVAAMKKIEDEMYTREMYYIPKKKIEKVVHQIEDGDILGITTNIKGLDCSHTGIAIWQKGELRMIHAPSPGKKVQITGLSLRNYLMQIKKDTGIIVARPINPK